MLRGTLKAASCRCLKALNWENQGYRSVEFGEWPTPRHHGLDAILAHDKSMSAMRAVLANTRQ